MSVVAIAGDIAVCIGQRGERTVAIIHVGVQDLGGLQVGDRYRRQVALGVVGVGRVRVQGVDGLGGLVVVAEADGARVVQGIDDLDDAPLAVPGVNGGVAVRISDRRFLVGDVVAEGGPGVGGISDAGHAVAGAIGDGGALVQGVGNAGELAAAVVAKAGGFACQIGDAGQVARRGAVLHGAARRVGDEAEVARTVGDGSGASLAIGERLGEAVDAERHLVAVAVFVGKQTAARRAKDVDFARGMEGEGVGGAVLDQGGLDAGGVVVAAIAVFGEGGGTAAGAGVVDRAVIIDEKGEHTPGAQVPFVGRDAAGGGLRVVESIQRERQASARDAEIVGINHEVAIGDVDREAGVVGQALADVGVKRQDAQPVDGAGAHGQGMALVFAWLGCDRWLPV